MRERRWARWRCSKTLGPGEKKQQEPPTTTTITTTTEKKEGDEEEAGNGFVEISLSLSFRPSLFMCAYRAFFFFSFFLFSFYTDWNFKSTGCRWSQLLLLPSSTHRDGPRHSWLYSQKEYTRSCDFPVIRRNTITIDVYTVGHKTKKRGVAHTFIMLDKCLPKIFPFKQND